MYDRKEILTQLAQIMHQIELICDGDWVAEEAAGEPTQYYFSMTSHEFTIDEIMQQLAEDYPDEGS